MPEDQNDYGSRFFNFRAKVFHFAFKPYAQFQQVSLSSSLLEHLA